MTTTNATEVPAWHKWTVGAGSLVQWAIKKFGRMPGATDHEEAYSDGLAVLVNAARGFQADRGFSFSTYFARCYRHARGAATVRLGAKRHAAPGGYVVALDGRYGEEAGLSDNGGALYSTIPDTREPDPAEAAAARELMAAAAAAMGRLHERERMIVTRRLGLDGDAPETLDEVAARIGRTRERVRQIERRALARLRKEIYAAGVGVG